MERVTKKNELGQPYYQACMDACGDFWCGYNCDVNQKHYELLSAYEDTGMTPEELQELIESVDMRFALRIPKLTGMTVGRFWDLVEAEKEGRIVVLPCEIGTTVYAISSNCPGCPGYESVLNDELIAMCKHCEREHIIEIKFDISLYPEYGKYVFLTREEAEAAMKARHDHD